MRNPREPTVDECTSHAPLGDGWFAIWYPQMGGYVGKAAVYPGSPGECFDVYVWHNGEFPFSDEDCEYPAPAHIHHCMTGQFISFAREVEALQQGRDPTIACIGVTVDVAEAEASVAFCGPVPPPLDDGI